MAARDDIIRARNRVKQAGVAPPPSALDFVMSRLARAGRAANDRLFPPRERTGLELFPQPREVPDRAAELRRTIREQFPETPGPLARAPGQGVFDNPATQEGLEFAIGGLGPVLGVLRGGLTAAELPKSMRWLEDTKRYDVSLQDASPDSATKTFRVMARGTDDMTSFAGREFRGEVRPRDQFFHDPKVSRIVENDIGEGYIRRHAELLPGSGMTATIPAKSKDGVLYRGMAAEEFEEFRRTGVLRSRGDMNLGPDQKGLTYYTTDPESAAFYSSGFAPVQHQATPNRPAYVVGVRDPGTSRHVAGVAEHERGIPGALSKDDVVEVSRGDVYEVSAGEMDAITDLGGFRSGSASPPQSRIGWRKVEP